MGNGILDASSYALNLHAVAPMAVGALIALLGFFVLVREKVSAVSMAFCGMTASGAAWLVSYGGLYCARDPSLALLWGRIENAAVVFIPSAVYLFALAVTRRLQALRAWVLLSAVVSALFCFGVLFTDHFVAGLRSYFWGPYPRYGWLSIPFLLFFFGLMAASLQLLWKGYRDAPSEVHRRRLKSFLVAFSIAYLGSVDYLPTYGIPVYPFGYLPVFAFLIIAARTIWRHQLVDITPAFAANQILRTMSDGLVVLDRDGVVRLVNQAACRLFGRSESELAGRPVWAIHATLFPREKLLSFLRTNVVRRYETSYQSPRGEEIILEIAASSIEDGKGEPMAVVCILRDVTERRQAEDNLRRAHEDLKRSHEELKAAQLRLVRSAKMESVGRLAAGVAHEVKNPLAVVLQGLDFLEGHLPPSRDETVTLVLNHGKDAVRRADRVIRGLLDFSATREMEMQEHDLNEVLEDALLLVNHELDKAHVRLVRELEADLPPVWMDKLKMEQVFVNLLLNAAQAMPPAGGTVTLRTRAMLEGDSGSGPAAVVAEVEDTGCGIPPEALSRIFEPFFTTKPAGSGTGLGLAVCKTIVESHGGTIAVENRVGRRGVRVVLTFQNCDMVKGGESKGAAGGDR